MNHYYPLQQWPWPITQMFIVVSYRVWLSGTIEVHVTKGAPTHAHKAKWEFSEGRHWPFRQIITLSHTRHTSAASHHAVQDILSSVTCRWPLPCFLPGHSEKTWRNHCYRDLSLLISFKDMPGANGSKWQQHGSWFGKGGAPSALEHIVLVGLCSKQQRN